MQLEVLLEQILTIEKDAGRTWRRGPVRESASSSRSSSREATTASAGFPSTRSSLRITRGLQAALDAGDLAVVEAAARAPEARVRLEANTIRESDVEPPHTTDFLGSSSCRRRGFMPRSCGGPGLSSTRSSASRAVVAGP